MENPSANERERTLVEKFGKLHKEVQGIAAALDEKKREFEDVEAELMDLLDDEGKKSSAKYDNIGHVTCVRPTPRASVIKDEDQTLFEYLKAADREDMIKTTVHPGTLSTYVKECLEAIIRGDPGAQLPPGMTYYLDRRLSFYPIKKTTK
jgi:seryl-tRNA synthetase